MKKITALFVSFIVLIILSSCNSYTPEEKEYISTIEDRRNITDEWMKDDPNSPFNYKGEVEFHDLNYFDVNPDLVFTSKIAEYDEKKEIAIFGTKGEERSAIRFGYLSFNNDGKDHKLNLYANQGQDSSWYYSIWFTDQTTNNESYGVGRYLSFDLEQDKEHIYTIDFNLAFNPYCAYSPDYSCAIPSKEDYLDLEVTAGEKIFHD